MPCYSPLTAYYSKEIGSTGRRGITFQRVGSFSGVPIRLPCGKCIGCRLEHSRQWAMRITHEAQLHKENCFITLTYRNECLPPGGTLVVRDVQLFLKRLRKFMFPRRFRYYGCGEYGELNFRPHYHLVLFNYDFPDKVLVGRNGRGDPYYTSVILDRLWKAGNCMLGDVTFDSAAYCARYTTKKVYGDKAEEHYNVYDRDGVVHLRRPEFSVMSRGSGIGTDWYKKYGKTTYAHDNVVVNGKLVRPPRYYDLKQELTDPVGFAKLKKSRLRKARLFRADNAPDRRRVREVIAIKRLKQLRRDV